MNSPLPNDRPATAFFHCVCGQDVDLRDRPSHCPHCQSLIPVSAASDPTVTVTISSFVGTPEATLRSTVDANRDLEQTIDGSLLTPDASPVSANDLVSSGSSNRVLPTSERVSAGSVLARSGRRLGHFLLEEPLGAGGMGAVYRALDTSLQRYVAVKVLRENEGSGSSGAAQADRLRREAVAQARLNHPHVVTIYYVGREGEEPFLAMELLPGPTLQERVASGPLPYDELIHLALQVVDALAAADVSGLVHGDIKPSNLMMAGAARVKLSDFGLARRSGVSNRDGSVSGTPHYIAPELLDGQAPDRRADMYALGVTLFELAFGRRPFDLQGDTLHQRLLSHQTAKIEFPEKWPAEIPESFRDVLERLLAKDPTDRYQDYAALMNDLQRVAPIGSTPAGRPARLIAWMIDNLCLFALQAPLVIPNMILNVLGEDVDNDFADIFGVPVGMGKFIAGLIALIGWIAIPVLALWWDLKRWRTPGRYLMQLRVVDDHGLPPPRRALILRNLMRYPDLWVSALFSLPLVLAFPFASVIEKTIGRLWIVLDGAFALASNRRALHDRICRTHVVLDEKASRKISFSKK